jgi:CHASE3 domain sensor protein
LVSGGCYYANAYLFTKVNNLEEIKRLETFKTAVTQAIEMNSSLRHLTNDENYQNSLHKMNIENRKKLKDIENELTKYK